MADTMLHPADALKQWERKTTALDALLLLIGNLRNKHGEHWRDYAADVRNGLGMDFYDFDDVLFSLADQLRGSGYTLAHEVAKWWGRHGEEMRRDAEAWRALQRANGEVAHV